MKKLPVILNGLDDNKLLVEVEELMEKYAKPQWYFVVGEPMDAHGQKTQFAVAGNFVSEGLISTLQKEIARLRGELKDGMD